MSRSVSRISISKYYCTQCGKEPNLIGSGGRMQGDTCGRLIRDPWGSYWRAKIRCQGTIQRKGKK